MNDKQYQTLAVVLGIAALIYWSMQRNGKPLSVQPATPNPLPIAWNSPMAAAYNANPAAFAPVTPAQLDISIANQTPNMLTSQYMPLFGFVGMAQGALYQ